MTHDEKRIWLIKELQKGDTPLSRYTIPTHEQGQKDLLRALMNTWEPQPLSGEFITIQREYLTEEARHKGIVSIDSLAPLPADSRLYLWQGDMTTLQVDAIVNPANSQLLGCWRPLHNCLDNLIHSGAGLELRYHMSEIMTAQGHDEPTGQAKITPAYNLPCRHILHTVGPIVDGPLTPEHERLLESCYTSCLNLAAQNSIESIAFCCISTGVFMFPPQRAAEIAVSTVRTWLNRTGSAMKVLFNVFKDSDLAIYEKLLLR